MVHSPLAAVVIVPDRYITRFTTGQVLVPLDLHNRADAVGCPFGGTTIDQDRSPGFQCQAGGTFVTINERNDWGKVGFVFHLVTLSCRMLCFTELHRVDITKPRRAYAGRVKKRKKAKIQSLGKSGIVSFSESSSSSSDSSKDV